MLVLDAHMVSYVLVFAWRAQHGHHHNDNMTGRWRTSCEIGIDAAAIAEAIASSASARAVAVPNGCPRADSSDLDPGSTAWRPKLRHGRQLFAGRRRPVH